MLMQELAEAEAEWRALLEVEAEGEVETTLDSEPSGEREAEAEASLLRVPAGDKVAEAEGSPEAVPPGDKDAEAVSSEDRDADCVELLLLLLLELTAGESLAPAVELGLPDSLAEMDTEGLIEATAEVEGQELEELHRDADARGEALSLLLTRDKPVPLPRGELLPELDA